MLKSGWEIVMERTDPRWVVAQIDIGWAVCGGSGHVTPSEPGVGVAYVQRMIDKFGPRVISFHVKDMAADGIRPNCGNPEQRTLGQGAINFAPMLASAKNETKYYFAERDPVAHRRADELQPVQQHRRQRRRAQGRPGADAEGRPQLLPPSPRAPPRRPTSGRSSSLNDGDAPLTIGTAANVIQIQADAADGGNTTAGDFAIVSEDCRGKTLAPGETCMVNVGFKPTRTNYVSVARVQFNTNADDAMERVLIAGQSTGNAISTPGGTVPTVLSLSFAGTAPGFGTFVPAVARTYETAAAAVVTHTAGDASLSVTDPAPRLRATSPTARSRCRSRSTSAPPTPRTRARRSLRWPRRRAPRRALLTYSGPTTADAVTVGFRQAIGATDVLRAGTYSKTLTFALSTTTP